MGSRKFLVLSAFVLLLIFSACVPAKPASVISSPPSGSQYNEGDQVAIQSTSADSAGVTRVELTIDGAVVRNDTPPSPQTSFTVIQTWKATAGSHTIIVRAYNAAGASSDPAAISISVGAAAAATPVPPTTATTGSLTGQVSFTGISSQPAPNVKVALVDAPSVSTTTGNDGRYLLSNVPAGPHVVSASANTGSSNPINVNIPAGGSTTADLVILTALPSPVPPTSSASSACTNSVAFVADVTVPDGTNWAPGQAFNKIWRVKNTGTCAWTTAYDFAFAGGEAMATTTAIALPDTAPGATADLLVAMVAPATPGTHAGQWKLRTVGDAFFGGAMTVKINVIDTSAPPPPVQPPPATGCSGIPNISSFTASATTINAGQSSTLNWGEVTGADSVEIDNGIGGVPAPGSATVSPAAPTTYTMTAHCGANTKTAQVAINVLVLAPPIAAVTITRNMTGGNENGTVYEAAASLPVVNGSMLAGDTSTNRLARAYMSFAIGDLAGKTVTSASLDLTGCSQAQDPFTGSLYGIWVGELQFPLPLDQSDYELAGTGIVRLTAKPSSAIDVKSYVQSRVSQGKSRFQIRLHPAGPSDGDGKADYLLCSAPKLTITYIP